MDLKYVNIFSFFTLFWQSVDLHNNIQCGGLVDITFLIDDSDSTKRPVPGSLSTVQYAPGVVEFIQHFVNNSDLGNVRISLILFSDTARVLTQFSADVVELNYALGSFTPEFQGTHTTEGIQLVIQQYTQFGRSGVSRSTVILLDGSSQNVRTARAEAMMAESLGINLVSVAFDIPIPVPELQMLAQDPEEAFKVTSDMMLSGITSNISSIICPETFTSPAPGVSTTLTPMPFIAPCSMQSSPSGPGFYREFIPGFGLIDRPCPGGTQFVQSDCACSLIIDVNLPQTCDLFLDVDFNNQITKDSSKHAFQLTAIPFVTYQGDDFAQFTSFQSVVVSGIANIDFRDSIFLVVKFKTTGVTEKQPVVHNSACQDSPQPSLLVTAHDRSNTGILDVNFLIKTTNDFSDETITLSGSKSTFITAVLSYNGSLVVAKLLDEIGNVIDIGSRPATGFVAIRKGGLNVGGMGCNTTNSFVGIIDFVRLYKCQPPDNATDDDVVVTVTSTTTTTTMSPTTQLGPVVFKTSQNSPTHAELLALCLWGDYVNGNSHKPYSSDCARFVQCHASDVSLVYTVKFCSFGSVWSASLGACVIPMASDCDPCRGQVDNTQFAYTLQCNTYWSCENEISQPRCCPSGQAYMEGLGCQLDSVSQCRDVCPGVVTPIVEVPCFFLVSSKGSRYYQTFVTGVGFQDVPCPLGSMFHLSTCGCHQTDTNPNQVSLSAVECPAFLHIPFDNKTASDISINRFSPDTSPFVIFQDNRSAFFNGFGYVLVPGLSNFEFKEDFTLQIRFRPKSSPILGAPQALIHNGGCTDPDGASFKITVADNIANSSLVDVDFQLNIANDVTSQTMLLSGRKSVMLEATLMYNGAIVTAKLNDGTVTRSATRITTGVIKKTFHALNIGSGLCGGHSPFRGNVDDVKVFVCKTALV